MENLTQKEHLIGIMHTMDDCLDEIKTALDKLQFEQVTNLVTVLTEAFVAVNEFVDSDFQEAIEPAIDQLEKDIHLVNEALVSVLATYDSHDLELRVGSYEALRTAMFTWTGNLFDVLKLHQ